MGGLSTSCRKSPRVVLQPRHRESLAVATKGNGVETISTALKNEVDGGGENDVNNTSL